MDKEDIVIPGEESDVESDVASDTSEIINNEVDYVSDEEIANDDEDESEEKDDDLEEKDDDLEEKDDDLEDIHVQDNIAFAEDEDDDEDDLDDDYLQKMDSKMRQNIVDTYHHELKIHNADEIDVACIVARNEDGYIVDPLHKTLPFITCYEKTRVLGERAKQIEAGAKPFVEVEENIIDSYLIALREYQAKQIPFIIQRPLPNGLSEYWKLSDLELLD